jgi:hypothetical protein
LIFGEEILFISSVRTILTGKNLQKLIKGFLFKKNCGSFKNKRWQARHEGDKQMRAGLIPSRMLQEKRIAYERAHSVNNNADQQGESLFL